MYLKITRKNYKGKILEHAKIVESYRDKGTSRQRIILNLGSIQSKDDLQRYNTILEDMRSGKEYIRIENISVENAKEFGITYVTNMLLNKYGIDTVMNGELSKNSAGFDVYGVSKALIINRFIKPSSELSAYEWIVEDYCEKLDVQEHHLYRALDYLITKKTAIELGIFNMLKKELNLNTDLTFYDLTSSYFEGNCCAIAFYGYNRDNCPSKKQIVIGLAMCDDLPITHEVYNGNTVDKSTLIQLQEDLKQRFGINKTIIVADNGLLTTKNIEMLEQEKIDYILACSRRKDTLYKQLFTKQISSKEKQYAMEVYKEMVQVNAAKTTRRYILCLDMDTRKQRLEELDTIKSDIEEDLKDLQQRYTNYNRGKKLTRESLMQKAYKIIGKNKRMFKISFQDGLVYSLDQQVLEYEKKIAGKFLLVTTTDKTAIDVMKTYKQLRKVEDAFDEIKNYLDIRGIYHRKPLRVKAHAFVCVLSFLIESIIEKFCTETARVVLKKLGRIKVVKLDLNGQEKKLLTKISKEHEKIFEELDIPKPVLLN